MKKIQPRTLTYANTIAELIVCPEGHSGKLLAEKIKALKKTMSLLNLYARDGFKGKLLDTIMEKKARMILSATSIKDVREIGDPQIPRFGGSEWIISPNSVPEEELILWSKALQAAPLSQKATERFFALFEQVYGKKIDKIDELDELNEL